MATLTRKSVAIVGFHSSRTLTARSHMEFSLEKSIADPISVNGDAVTCLFHRENLFSLRFELSP